MAEREGVISAHHGWQVGNLSQRGVSHVISMNSRKRALSALFVLCYLVAVAAASFPFVLCVGHDGHVAFEFAGPDHCGTPDGDGHDDGDHSAEIAHHVAVPLLVHDSCTDVRVAFFTGPPADRLRDIRKLRDTAPVGALAWSDAGRRCLPASVRHAQVAAFGVPPPHPSISLLRTVILRI